MTSGADAIWIVVPAAAREHPAARKVPTWVGLAHSLALDPPPPDAYQLAEMRLERALDRFLALGVAVGGRSATRTRSERSAPRPPGTREEVLNSTLPRAVSQWLCVDLPRRVQRRFHIPVTTVSAASGKPA